jgi:hypothetical protein
MEFEIPTGMLSGFFNFIRVRSGTFVQRVISRINPEQERLYRSLLSRRAVHYPLAYLEGVQEFLAVIRGE